MKTQKVPTIPEFVKIAKEAGVKLYACKMTMNLLGLSREDLIDEVDDVVDALDFVKMSKDAQVIFV